MNGSSGQSSSSRNSWRGGKLGRMPTYLKGLRSRCQPSCLHRVRQGARCEGATEPTVALRLGLLTRSRLMRCASRPEVRSAPPKVLGPIGRVAARLAREVHQPFDLALGEVGSFNCQVYDGWRALL